MLTINLIREHSPGEVCRIRDTIRIVSPLLQGGMTWIILDVRGSNGLSAFRANKVQSVIYWKEN